MGLQRDTTEWLTHTPGVTPGQLSQVNGVISITILGLEWCSWLSVNARDKKKLRDGVGMSVLFLIFGSKRKAESLMIPFQIPKLTMNSCNGFCYFAKYLPCIFLLYRSEYPRCHQNWNIKLSGPGTIPNSPEKWFFICLQPSYDHTLIYSQDTFVQS